MFAGKKEIDKKKLRGGYYTPDALAKYLCEWAIRSKKEKILEPSCGDGNFTQAALSRLSGLRNNKTSFNITAVEIDSDEIEKAKVRSVNELSKNNKINWINDDFFNAYTEFNSGEFDVVIGNPPFIRFQYFEDESREQAFSHLRDLGYKPTKLANSWAAFVQLSIALLRPKGRLAMVIPAELLQVKYASELRERLTQEFNHIVLVSFKKLVFRDIQQEVVLLLAEGKRSVASDHCDIHTVEITNEEDLDRKVLDMAISHSEAKHTNKNVKWTSLFLNENEFKAVESVHKIKGIKRLGDFVSVDVGIVTGRNKFFVVDNDSNIKYDLGKFSIPLVGKTSAIKTLVFDNKKMKLFESEHPSKLLNLKNIEKNKFSKGLIKYISLGEKEDVHKGYKCRIRKRWYDVPSTHISDGFLFRQIHKYPLLVQNKAKAACTDTIHRVQLISKDVDFSQLSCSFINSLTFAYSEVGGRSYGGGVLELEPNEAEEIPIPYMPEINLNVDYVNGLVESGDIVSALDYVDEKLLIGGMGLSKRKVKLLRNSWERLSSRRTSRK